ncbi:hypothetical protein BN7_6764 [Wickerhamomyces ciferrii]|uniref:NAD(P)H-hydrate epimerase n=1 Tax=Wickerhamomyces ciferrii (strain ATCC 14091 / BCRC 22168 / CBS 111 / JCM 3599 / NBRC 0793 / NRRL Y-1031 F-60-10) TaxID=1206466 RepID=K0KPG2_WICCF|nr:uncharacterized protein BN7_6764 [Wickerhamomyces ciferrii]CCH47150.1 hypothetical protein BN7_6764 [Wickerhamomyces ciferrii]
MSFKVLSAKLAASVDQELMSSGGLSIDQLVIYGTSGLCVNLLTKVLLGGDGLVAARHLKLWGFNPSIYYPKRSSKPLFQGLETQLKNLNIEFIDSDLDPHTIESKFQLIIDSIFGFSFNTSGGIRPPFDELIKTVNKTTIPILSVDIPSGWDVDEGYVSGGLRSPDVLISLTAPKPVANHMSQNTQHFVGGRFIGKEFAEKYGIDYYDYKGSEQTLKLSRE